MKPRNHRPPAWWPHGLLGLVVGVILLAGCNNSSHADDTSHSSGLAKLSLIAYNYTDHTISDYYVNGAWGGDVAVSGPRAGGSKQTCCVLWKKKSKAPGNGSRAMGVTYVHLQKRG